MARRVTLTSLAFHEAGHAVIARVLGLTGGAAEIDPIDKTCGGYAMMDDPWIVAGGWERRKRYREVRTAYRGRILADMAGAETERELLGGTLGGDDSDRLRILEFLDETGLEEKWDHYEPRMRAFTRQLIRRHRAKIERVARALVKRRKLEGAEIDELIRNCRVSAAPDLRLTAMG
jgi:hypothetical protein